MTCGSALVAMSGGVDSSAAAWLSIEAGLSCAGAMMRLHGTCDEDGARSVASRLGIPFFVYDFTDKFSELVIEKFIDTYRRGATPNPCIECNRHLKFGAFMDRALSDGRDFVVTGHYARVEFDAVSGRYLLKKGVDASKDQSYALYTLTQKQLAHTRLPLGMMRKSEVRELAHQSGFVDPSALESQDICFVPDGDYAGFIERHAGAKFSEGRFVDENGADMGGHKGVIHYTVGQRKGLGLPASSPLYVLSIDPERNTITVGDNDRLFSKSLIIRDINLIAADSLAAPVKACVKIRYKQPEQPAIVTQTGDNELRIEFDSPQRAITRGQAAVIYDGDCVVGGGTII